MLKKFLIKENIYILQLLLINKMIKLKFNIYLLLF